MKRSHAIALGATGVLLAGAYLGSGGTQKIGPDGGSTADAAIFANAQECIASTLLSRDVCEEQFRKANEAHATTAPKFADQAGCEAQYGASQCQRTTHNGASVFIPAMIGMMVANHLNNARQAQPLYPQRGAAPGCQPGAPATAGCSTTRSYTTAGGYAVARSAASGAAAASVKVPQAAAVAPIPRTTVAPAGFRPSGNIAPSSTSSATSASQNSNVARGGFGTTGHSTAASSAS